MNDKYQIEIDEFTENFQKYKNAKIVLYGIGRYTVTLLKGLKGFRFVGLMDKDPENIGKEMFGLPIIDKGVAEKIADLIIINTSETYWNVIYGRIQDAKIPVYYKNGKKAKKIEILKGENPFKDLSYNELCMRIEEVDFVSFDFFETLFMRCVCNPRDVFHLLQIELDEKWKGKASFAEMRNEAKDRLKEIYSLEELYIELENTNCLPHSVWQNIRNKELQLEEQLLIPRYNVISSLKFAQKIGKEVYIISDMYLPLDFYMNMLNKNQIFIPSKYILISNLLNVSKSNGSMWQYFSDKIVKGRPALHIGDDYRADVAEPTKYKLQTYWAPSVWDMLMASSIKDIAAHVRNDYDTAVMGCVLSKLFKNPYVLEQREECSIQIENNIEMGYCVFGPVILSFLLWLLKKSREDKIETIIFMSRDGYFLKEDFQYLCELMGEVRKSKYIEISRQLAMIASIETQMDVLEYASMPYSGSIIELFEDRFEIENIEEIPGKTLETYIEENLSIIKKYIFEIKENYLHYIEQKEIDNTCALVDLGYYGNNQKYLNKLIKGKMCGYYFNANLSKENRNTASQKMTACFQKEEDYHGKNSQVLRKMIYLESFLTAPYGMVKAVDKEGNFRCAKSGKNQEHFQDKMEINQGVKQFICDYIKRFGEFEISPDLEFIDWYYGYCFSGVLEFAKNVKASFYNDNAMMNRVESMLFY